MTAKEFMELKNIPDGTQVVYNHLGERVVLDLALMLHSFAAQQAVETINTPTPKKKATK